MCERLHGVVCAHMHLQWPDVSGAWCVCDKHARVYVRAHAWCDVFTHVHWCVHICMRPCVKQGDVCFVCVRSKVLSVHVHVLCSVARCVHVLHDVHAYVFGW